MVSFPETTRRRSPTLRPAARPASRYTLAAERYLTASLRPLAGAAGAGVAGAWVAATGVGVGAGSRGVPARRRRRGTAGTTASPTTMGRVSESARHEDDCSATDTISSSATVAWPDTTRSRSPTRRPSAFPPSMVTVARARVVTVKLCAGRSGGGEAEEGEQQRRGVSGVAWRPPHGRRRKPRAPAGAKPVPAWLKSSASSQELVLWHCWHWVPRPSRGWSEG